MPPTEGHQRLSRTVTLGEIDQPTAANSAPVAASNGALSITINNYTQAAPAYVGYGYAGGYGAYSGRGSVTNAARGGGSSLQPGQNWPAPADHGTSFPYRSAPASPWAKAQ